MRKSSKMLKRKSSRRKSSRRKSSRRKSSRRKSSRRKSSRRKSSINISLKDLIIDERIADMVETQGKTFPNYLLNNLQEMDTFKLNQERLQSIMESSPRTLPPIDVTQQGSKYMVQNGRHRVAVAILRGDSSIRAEIK
jgi:hypothetical protein